MFLATALTARANSANSAAVCSGLPPARVLQNSMQASTLWHAPAAARPAPGQLMANCMAGVEQTGKHAFNLAAALRGTGAENWARQAQIYPTKHNQLLRGPRSDHSSSLSGVHFTITAGGLP